LAEVVWDINVTAASGTGLVDKAAAFDFTDSEKERREEGMKAQTQADRRRSSAIGEKVQPESKVRLQNI